VPISLYDEQDQFYNTLVICSSSKCHYYNMGCSIAIALKPLVKVFFTRTCCIFVMGICVIATSYLRCTYNVQNIKILCYFVLHHYCIFVHRCSWSYVECVMFASCLYYACILLASCFHCVWDCTCIVFASINIMFTSCLHWLALNHVILAWHFSWHRVENDNANTI